jgi:hypothetical protein
MLSSTQTNVYLIDNTTNTDKTVSDQESRTQNKACLPVAQLHRLAYSKDPVFPFCHLSLHVAAVKLFIQCLKIVQHECGLNIR